jgi:hypothetical protein
MKVIHILKKRFGSFKNYLYLYKVLLNNNIVG